MIVIYTRQNERIEVPEGVAVAPTTVPHLPVVGVQPAAALAVVTADGKTVALFRVSQVVGYDTTGTSVSIPTTSPTT